MSRRPSSPSAVSTASRSTTWPPAPTVRVPPSTDTWAANKRLSRPFWASPRNTVDTVREAVVSLHGPERAQVAIEVALREIRADPVTSQFIRSGRFLEGTRLVLHSPVVARIAAELIDLDPTDKVPAALAVRSVLALLIWPASTPELEIQMIEELAVAVCRH